jgi:large subunit ribosomal protein L31
MQKLPSAARLLGHFEALHPQSYPQLLWITDSRPSGTPTPAARAVRRRRIPITSLVSRGVPPYNSRPTFEACPDAAAMKEAIHPNYKQITVTCSCGNTFETRSTLGQDLQIEVCSSCHPFYTGKQKIVDTGGRVDRFRKKYAAKA